MIHKFYLFLLCFSFVLSVSVPLNAQQAIINLPSADITPKNKLFIMNESFVKMWGTDGHWSSTNFITYGLNENWELAITNYGLKSDNLNNLSLAFGAKHSKRISSIKILDDVKITSGYMLPISMQGNGVGSNFFSHLSFRLPKVKTRLTTGIATGTRQVYGRDTVCFIGGIEHPINKELNIVLEYFSGTHDFAGIIPGLVYHNLKRDVVAVVAYRIPANSISGDSGFVFELGKYFDFN